MFKSVNEHVIRTHTKPETRVEFVLVAIAVFFSPLNYFRPGIVFFTLGDFFILLAFFVVLFKGRLPLRPLGSASTLWFASVLTFLAGFAAASIINGDAMAGALGLMQYCFSFVLLPWIILRRSRKETETLIFLFVLSIALAMIHGAYYVNFVPGRNDFVSGNGRLSGLFEKENESGVLAALSLVFLVWLRGVHRVTTLGAILLFLPVTYGVLLTGSNTAFYLCIVGVIDDRLFLIQESMKFGNETLWLGYGIDQYEEKSAIGAPVHNAYLLTLTEGGAVSLVGLAGLFASGIYVIWRYKMMMGGAKNTALAVTILMMLMMVLNTSPHFYARFWLVPWMLGLSVCLTGREIKLPSVARPLRRAQ